MPWGPLVQVKEAAPAASAMVRVAPSTVASVTIGRPVVRACSWALPAGSVQAIRVDGPRVRVNGPSAEPVQVPDTLLQPVVPVKVPPVARSRVAGAAAAGVWVVPERYEVSVHGPSTPSP